MRMVLDRPDQGVRGKLRVTAVDGEVNTRDVIRLIMKKIMRSRKYLKAVPATPMLIVAPTGRSFHSGGSFPMSANPGEFQSDVLGRPYGFTRVHAVDSTVFPSIPATTITLSIMANAHRIATAVARG